MDEQRMRFFDNLHPAVSMAYFVLVLVLTLICMHPVMVALSFLGASWFSIRLRGLKSYGRTMCFVGPMFILIALANPLFNHRGVTPLFEINHLWYTLEATIYGLVSACSLCSVVIWFTCYQKVMTSDKFLYLFGKPFPGTALLITMTLRFIPQLQQNRREIKQAQAMLNEKGTRLFQKLGMALRNLSVLLTMSLENAVETADSMKARGYGARRRTTFHLFRFDGRDARTLGAIIAISGVVILARCFGHGYMEFYPRMTPLVLGAASYTMFVFCAVLMILPGILETKEAIRWRSCVSKV
ncbi:MAG: energy-coupling factor transporter transmembrane protein EcfT [Aeriscardovia sp.]|nr:energy-coupling factor transporter transmembrane protein EcfT [Aeriscardovia sp.]